MNDKTQISVTMKNRREFSTANNFLYTWLYHQFVGWNDVILQVFEVIRIGN